MTRTPGVRGALTRLGPFRGEYHEPTAQDAYRRIVAFFREHLDGAPAVG